MLAEGGSAVDACIASAFVSWVAESTLTGPGAGGFMLVHRARDRSTRLLDHFVTVPGLGLPREARAMDEVTVEFSPESRQLYRIGPASCAVPGAVAGLGEAHRRFGSLPWHVLLEPAIEHARKGVELNEPQAFLHEILDVLLRHTPEGQELYGSNGNRLVAGDRLVMTDLALTLERLAEHGAADLYTGELARALSEHVQAGGGAITLRDLAEYRVIQRRPVRVQFLGHEFESNPPPATGGILIGLGLRLFDRLGMAGGAGHCRGDGPARRDHARAGSGTRRPVRARALSRRPRASALRRGRAGGCSSGESAAACRSSSKARRTSRSWTGTGTRRR